eukprot:TRINITY_DN18363_c0_g1_i1.p1 TRINITY_DN18363_c0_g1~~TRINITY_DN18363_c0_g1_i1.p1  ORF type:complete len:184 (-),score=32.67 TRINITY_DN18363_c0_g1_i1:63-614(-)
MNKELVIRKRIQSIYNKEQEDFEELREYNDYLETIEDIVFNLVEGIDVAATEARVARYQEENQEQILSSHARKASEKAANLKAQRAAVEPSVEEIEAEQEIHGSAERSGGMQYAPSGLGYSQPPAVPLQPTPVAQARHVNGESDGLDDESRRLREDMAAKAGGYVPAFAIRRAIDEAMASIAL